MMRSGERFEQYLIVGADRECGRTALYCWCGFERQECSFIVMNLGSRPKVHEQRKERIVDVHH